MKLQQLRYLVEVAKQGLSISAAAEKLHTSQPGISKQIRLLEDELGVQVFIRNGKRVVDVTAPGREILAIAERMLMQAQNLKKIASDFVNVEGGDLTIATTHTQARYALPPVIRQFSQCYPKVRLRIKQGSPVQICEMVVNGEADIAIATEGISLFSELTMLSCYTWNRSVIVPTGHPLTLLDRIITLQDIATYPLITYDFAFAGRTKINSAFDAQKLVPNIVLTAIDSDIIKAYVELGLGVGILASMAYDENKDTSLIAIDAGHLFEPSTTQLGFRKDTYLRAYMYDFIELFTPHLTRPVIQAALLGEEINNK
jgi:LysR family cys regulon transcriptional activator